MIRNCIHLAVTIIILSVISLGCKNNTPETVTDIDGNVYNTITIGNKLWMAENLKVLRFSNGDSIFNIPGNNNWRDYPYEACCSYNNNDSLSAKYGRLYNWKAVADSRGLAPKGWHVASDEDWETLIDYFGGDSIAGGKLREAENKFGSNALLGGFRNGATGKFQLFKQMGVWWSNTENSDSTAWVRMINNTEKGVYRNYACKHNGYFVRCVKD